METSQLTSSDYWFSDAVDIRLNPRRRFDVEGLHDFLWEDQGIRSAVVLATSGSAGAVKFVVLPKAALLLSASAVLTHCGLEEDEVSLAGLSGFHVGGLGIYARAFVSGSRVVEMETEKWQRNGKPMIECIQRENVSLTSMTPTHLHDLVQHEVSCPESLRTVFLGGGRMDPALIASARELGWPIRVSYGMTEAGSQIATSCEESVEWLPLLPIWEARVETDGRLAIRGQALFSGYARKSGGEWEFSSGKTEDGWFVTGDRCELRGRELRFLGRADDLVKVSGELVSVAEVNALASSIAHEMGTDAAVVALADERRESELVVVAEAAEIDAKSFFTQVNRELDGIEQVSRVVLVEQLPRTEIGKLDRAELQRIAEGS